MDSIADLSLAEGVFQVTQGNYERAGAMLKALSEGNAPPDPKSQARREVGQLLITKLTVQFETGNVEMSMAGRPNSQIAAASGLNKWLGELIGLPQALLFSVNYELDEFVSLISLADLNLQPIDLSF